MRGSSNQLSRHPSQVTRHFKTVPEGLPENSPAFQRRECVLKQKVPQGRLTESLGRILTLHRYPNRRAPVSLSVNGIGDENSPKAKFRALNP